MIPSYKFKNQVYIRKLNIINNDYLFNIFNGSMSIVGVALKQNN